MDIELSCEDKSIKTNMLIRRNINDLNNFTVALKLLTPNELGRATALLRFQGPHGGQSEILSISDLHNDYHIHYYSELDYLRKRKLPSVDNRRKANYDCIEGAIISFLDACNIADPNGIFDEERDRMKQITLFDEL